MRPSPIRVSSRSRRAERLLRDWCLGHRDGAVACVGDPQVTIVEKHPARFIAELRRRIVEIGDEFEMRDDPAGEPIGILAVLHRRRP